MTARRMSASKPSENFNTCIILAGGLGTRLKSLLPDTPKCLAPVGLKSFLEIQLGLLKQQGIHDFVLSLGHLAHLVQDELAKLQGKFAIRHIVENSPLGTGGAVLHAMETLGINEAMVTNGDTYLGGDLSAMLLPLSPEKGEFCRMAVIEVPDMFRYGGVDLIGDRIVGFREKGHTGVGLINAGFYRISRQSFFPLQPGKAFSFETLLMPDLANRKKVTGSVIAGDFIDIGVPEDYEKFRSHIEQSNNN